MSSSEEYPTPPAAGVGKRGDDGYLGYLLRQAAAAYRLRQDREFADLGITAPQFAVMTMLKAYPGQSNADLARLAILTPQTTSVIIANLERAGHIERRAHEVHGRILQIDLTPSGHSLLQACRARVEAVEKELAENLRESDIDALRRSLVAIAKMNMA
ncbi:MULTISPECIES: MarR family winged helix-turn-helix transcriptional regulator [unclassified Aureimonas]|uniref:MarR family winged helix-turn-helix transcriptional regulator n=1 Tax=unclassified Aureimonas TaxID=2615206 RepID=UPI0006F4671D|nr:MULTISPECIES: MarR family transcriptional regulator [unclassified Aureimonas]KQT63294.1 MarR family transcriptional regulator [Aureimonas sp. Leaf427]KQT80126.1 MarR family transcriptional regulator [Aureimonas sp. Leaf460]